MHCANVRFASNSVWFVCVCVVRLCVHMYISGCVRSKLFILKCSSVINRPYLSSFQQSFEVWASSMGASSPSGALGILPGCRQCAVRMPLLPMT